MPKSDYIHRIETYQNLDVLVIEDLDLGRMSVTNDIENVIHEIEVEEKIDAKGYLIVYKDSEGFFDGFNYAQGIFKFLHEQDWQSAVETYIQLFK